MIHGWFIKVRLQRCQFGERAVGNWPLASRQNSNAAVSTPHTWLRAFESIKTASQCSKHADLALFTFSHCGSGPFGERGGTAATRPAMHFNASLTNTTRRARSLTKPRNKSLMMEGFYSPHYALLEALTAGRHNLDFSSWLVDTVRPIPADQWCLSTCGEQGWFHGLESALPVPGDGPSMSGPHQCSPNRPFYSSPLEKSPPPTIWLS